MISADVPQLLAANGITAASGEGFAVAVRGHLVVFFSPYMYFSICAEM